jgi:hypothetical protein
VGAQPSASRIVNLTVNEVNHVPVVTLSNELHNVAVGASTVARTKLADIAATANLAQAVVLSLTGTDAAHFELFGGDLYLKAGEDTSVAVHYDVTITATDTGGVTNVPFSFTIGVVAAVHTYDTVGTFTLVCPLYNTLKIEVQAPGNATWGYTPGAPTPPTAPGRTYVQNDQTVTLLHRWRVEATRMADNPDAWTPGYTIPTATQASLGIGAALEAALAGVQGGVGVTVQTKDATYDAPSGQGGYAVWDTLVVLGGGSVKATAPVDDNPTTAAGSNGTVPGAGASGGVYKKNTLTAAQVMPGFGGATPTPTHHVHVHGRRGVGHVRPIHVDLCNRSGWRGRGLHRPGPGGRRRAHHRGWRRRRQRRGCCQRRRRRAWSRSNHSCIRCPMTLSLPTALDNAVRFEVATLCHLMEITRQDGEVIRLTDADFDIRDGDNVYRSDIGFTASALLIGVNLNQVQGFTLTIGLVDDGITKADLKSRRYDAAQVLYYECDFKQPTDSKFLIFKGRVGRSTITDVDKATIEVVPFTDDDAKFADEVYSPNVPREPWGFAVRLPPSNRCA